MTEHWTEHGVDMGDNFSPLAEDREKPNGHAKDKKPLGKIERWDDIEDIVTKEVKTKEFVVEGLNLTEHAVALVIGADGHAKSYFWLWVAVQIATGGDINGIPCRKLPVLYIDFQNADFAVQQRVRAITQSRDPIPNLKVWGTWCHQYPPMYQSEVLPDFCRKYQPVVIIDVWRNFHDQKEKDPDEVAPVVAYVRNLLLEGARVVILIHHPPVGDTTRGRGTGLPRTESEFAFLQSLDGDVLTLVLDKNRFGPRKTYTFSVDFEEGTFKRDLSEQAKKRNTDIDALSDLIANNPGINQSEVCERMPGNKRTIVRMLQQGEEYGRWRSEPGPRNSVVYSMNRMNIRPAAAKAPAEREPGEEG